MSFNFKSIIQLIMEVKWVAYGRARARTRTIIFYYGNRNPFEVEHGEGVGFNYLEDGV